MPSLRVSLNIELDDEPLSGFPLVKRLEVTAAQPFDYQQVTGASFVVLPDSRVTTLAALLVRADQVVALKLASSAAAVVTLNPGGLLLLLDVNQAGDAGGTVNSLQNNSGSTAEVKGIAVGV